MKKITTVIFLVLASLSLSFAQKKASGNFVLGLDDSFPPLGFRDENNEIVGYDIDLAREVASRLGLTLVCQPIDWATKEMELNSGNIDCIWNGLTLTEERKAAMSCTKPYLSNAQVVVVRRDSKITRLEDMKGKKVGVQAGSSAQDAIDDSPEFKKSLKEIVEFKENITAMNDLEVGNLDGVVMDYVVAVYSIGHGNKSLSILEDALAPEEYGVAFSKKNVELRDKVQATLEEMQADGTVSKISEKWFGKDISTIGKK